MSDFNFTISGGSSKRLLTKGKYCAADIVVTAEGGGGGGDSQLDAVIDRSITDVSSNATSIGNHAFEGCFGLKTANCPEATSTGQYAFSYCSNLESVNFPKLTIVGDRAFESCQSLRSADFPKVTSIGTAAFMYTYISALILRSEKAATLLHNNAFLGSWIANGKGYIYIPAALKDTYASATNWSKYATQFRALEDYTVDGTITGELDPNKI